MHPLDLSPRTSTLPAKYQDLESAVMVKSVREDQSHKIPNLNRREREGKRGRPRADLLTALMVEGSSSRSRTRCNKCGRVFPREKSLQAHLRTHTGERPYTCDYPGCMKAFCQSGQLKTHQRLHTGERPFACVVEGCNSRFTHANRHCNQHPCASLKRLDVNLADVAKLCETEPDPEVKKWITKYIKQCHERANPKPSVKKIPSTECRDNEPLEISGMSASLSQSWSLPKISSSQLLTGHNSLNPSHSPLVTSALLSQSSMLSSPLSLSPLTPRQSSASSTASSSSGVSGLSTLSSQSTSSALPHQEFTTFEPVGEAEGYIYFSQMILQGQYSDIVPQFNSTPLTHRNESSATPDSGLMDYRTPPPDSPVLMHSLRSPTSSLHNKQCSLVTFSKLSTPAAPNRPPSPSLSSKPPVPPIISKPSIVTLPSVSAVSHKPLTIGLSPKCPSISKHKKSVTNSIESTDSISYRTTPKNREKDRYISALALIELSKG